MKVKGTYIAVNFSKISEKLLDDILKKLSLKKDFDDKYHCTLVYSRKELPYFKIKNNINKIVKIKEFNHFDTKEGKNLHIVLDCDFCKKEFHRAKTQGATFDYDNYTPHVTLMYDCKDFDVKDNKEELEEFIGKELNIITEYKEELKLDLKK